MQQEPALTEDGFAILTGKYGGKLVAQSCLTPMVHTAIGGPGREFWVNGRNYPRSAPTWKEPHWNPAGAGWK